MIQWIHAGVGLVALLVLAIFLMVYVGIKGSVDRICGAPLPGKQGPRGLPGVAGKSLYPGPAGDPGVTPGLQGDPGDTAEGIQTGPRPPPPGTGDLPGDTGNTGFIGPDGPLLDPKLPAPPIDFKVDNNGIGSPLDNYQDTGNFTIAVTCQAGAPQSKFVNSRMISIGKIVCLRVNQIVFDHGGATPDYIHLDAAFYNAAFISRGFFFPVTEFATTPYVLDQPVMVYDQVNINYTDGLFHMKIIPAPTDPKNKERGEITEMWIQYRATYSPDVATAPVVFQNLDARFPSDTTGTFGTVSDIIVTWNTI